MVCWWNCGFTSHPHFIGTEHEDHPVPMSCQELTGVKAPPWVFHNEVISCDLVPREATQSTKFTPLTIELEQVNMCDSRGCFNTSVNDTCCILIFLSESANAARTVPWLSASVTWPVPSSPASNSTVPFVGPTARLRISQVLVPLNRSAWLGLASKHMLSSPGIYQTSRYPNQL